MKKINIKIATQCQYLPDQSSKDSYRHLWSYDIIIVNESEEIIQLLNRVWRITDGRGKIEEIRGPGVIGLQPLIKPGKEFAYSSFCQLGTTSGSMEGQYEMQTIDEVHFFIDIPKIILASPSSESMSIRSQLH